MQIATFRVICPKTAELIKSYQVEYSDNKQLYELFQESRKVWAEYQVEVETEYVVFSNSHTYKEQLQLS